MAKWLSKYEQGGLVLKQKTKDNYGKKENANEGHSTAGPGWVGEGTTNRGFDYNGAWGGTMQNGGFLQPTSSKLPEGYVIPYNTPSTELAMSIGGEKGEPAYLIPSFKGGKKLKDPIAEYKKTGEHLGGPFKTWQEAEKFGEMRHNYVEKGQDIPTPLKTWGDMAMGGSVPGAVGFTYARTQNPAPSNGPYAKKTLASAQNGKEIMKGKEFVEQWMNSPRYNEMLNASAQGPELERINKGRIESFNVPTLVHKLEELRGTNTLGNQKLRVKNMFNATPSELEDMTKVLQYSVNNPKDKEAKRKAKKITDPEITGWEIGLNPILEPGTANYEAVLAHEFGHTTGRPFMSKLPYEMSTKELMRQDRKPFIPVSDIEKIKKYSEGKINDNFTKYVSDPEETRQYINELRYLGKTQGVYDPFKEKITPEQYKKIKALQDTNPVETLKKVYTDDQIIDMLNSVSKNDSNTVTPQAQNGKEMSFYQNGLDFTPKTISKNGGWLDGYDNPIKDDRGQWAHPGKVTEINSNDITMQGVDYPVLGISDTGDTQMMYPDQDYKFEGKKVTEYPMAQDGENISKKLKKEAEETIARRNANRPTVSQYTPKPGEQERLEKGKAEKRKADASSINRLAANPHMAKAMENIVEPMFNIEMAMSAGKLAKPAINALGKYLGEKTALKGSSKFDGIGDLGISNELRANYVNKLNDQEFGEYVSKLSPKEKNKLYGLDPIDIHQTIKKSIRNNRGDMLGPIDDYRNLDVYLSAKDTYKQIDDEMIRRSGIEKKALGEIEKSNLGVRTSSPNSKFNFSDKPYNAFSDYGYGIYDDESLKELYSNSFDDRVKWHKNMLKKLPKNKNGGWLNKYK